MTSVLDCLTHLRYASLLALGWLVSPLAAQDVTRALVIQDARIFDGSAVIPKTSVLVDQGRIVAMAPDVPAPANAIIVNGAGHTLIPGLIDSYTHVTGPSLRQFLALGVTTVLDMASDPRSVRLIKREQAGGRGLDMADLYSSGLPITGPEASPVPPAPDEVQALVDARVADGSDYIAIFYDDGRADEEPLPTMSLEALRALIEAAHARGKPAVVHTRSVERARDALAAGADGLVRPPNARLPDPALIQLAVDNRAFIIPRLALAQAEVATPWSERLLADRRVRPYLSGRDIRGLEELASHETPAAGVTAALGVSIRRLHGAGVTLLAGSGSGARDVPAGAGLLVELELLVEAGLTPVEALATATSKPADAFGLADRGRIAPGLRGDLVLVRGDPTSDITALRDILTVWKLGTPLDRGEYRKNLGRETLMQTLRLAWIAGGIVAVLLLVLAFSYRRGPRAE